MNPDKTELEAFKRVVSEAVGKAIEDLQAEGYSATYLARFILPDTDEAAPEQPPAPTLAEAARVVLAECERQRINGMSTASLRDWANPPAPVDPLLVEARKIAARTYQNRRDHEFAKWIGDGDEDHIVEVQVALAALRRGMELAQERGE